MRGYLVACTLMGALVFAACGGSGSPTPATTLDDCRNLRPNLAPACAYAPSPTPEARATTTARLAHSVAGTANHHPWRCDRHAACVHGHAGRLWRIRH